MARAFIQVEHQKPSCWGRAHGPISGLDDKSRAISASAMVVDEDVLKLTPILDSTSAARMAYPSMPL